MTKPYRFQAQGIRMIQRFNGRVLLADEMGLGKSLQALVWTELAKVKPGVIVCPASLKWNWEHEIKLHTSLRCEVLSGRRPPRGAFRHSPQLTIINYDILGPWLPFLKDLDPQVVILDECHYLKTPGTKRTKAVQQLCEDVPHILALSGTPLTIRPAELYMIVHILWPTEFPKFAPYARRYCEPTWKPWGYEFKGARRLPELHRRLKKAGMIRRRKVDVLKDLPARSRRVITLDIERRREYNLALTDFIQWLQLHYKANHKVAAATRAYRMMQMGYLKRLAGELKLKSVMTWIDSFLEETDEKLILFGIHTKVLKPLYERYEKRAALVTGKVVGHRRELAWERFNTKKGCRLLIGNLIAAGVGKSATDCSTTATIELGWTPGDHAQADDRVHGIGRGTGRGVNNFYLVAHGTIEEDLCKLLQDRQKVLDSTLDGVKTKDLNIYDQLTEILLKGNGHA